MTWQVFAKLVASGRWAAARGQIEVVKRLLDAGADVQGEGDAHRSGVLGWALTNGHRNALRVAALLLERGARHSIFTAVAMNDRVAVQALVAAEPLLLNARMSRFEQYQTPLHWAVRENLPDMVELLLRLGADANERDGEGTTPMRRVTRASDPRIERALLEAGAAPEEPGGVPFRDADPRRQEHRRFDPLLRRLHRLSDRRRRRETIHGATVNCWSPTRMVT